MRVKVLLSLLLSFVAVTLWGTPVTLRTADVSLTLLPERGGKIIALANKESQIAIPADGIHTDASGLAHVRIWGGSGGYMSAPWKIVSQSSRSIVLQATAIPPQRSLEITKTYTLPEKGGYLRVDLKFRNSNPLAGSFTIVPWVSNAIQVPFGSAGKDNVFMLSHKGGVQAVEQSKTIVLQPTLKNPGNWSAYINEAQRQGLLMVSAQQPEALYDFISNQTTVTVEMLFKAFDPVKQDMTFTYYLAPIAKLNADTVAKLGIPQPLTPAVEAKRCDGDNIDLFAHFRQSDNKNIPVDLRFYKSTAWVSPDVVLPLIFGVQNNRGGALEAEIDLPEFVSFEGCSGNFWFYEQEDFKLKSKKQITLNGKNYTRCRFDMTARRNIRYPNHARVYVRATQPKGKDVIAYRAFRNGELSMENTVPCEVLNIPKARIPKEFKIYFGVDYCMLNTYPKFTEQLKYLGFNALNFSYNVPNKVVKPEEVRSANAELKKQGFSTSVMGIFFAPRGEGKKCVTNDINGKTVKNFDFTARGPWKDEVVTHALDKGLTLGYDMMISDWEPYFGANTLGFSPQAIDEFKRFLASKYPKMAWVEPATIVKNSVMSETWGWVMKILESLPLFFRQI